MGVCHGHRQCRHLIEHLQFPVDIASLSVLCYFLDMASCSSK